MRIAPDGLAYLFVDFNSYFASVEQHLNPAWRGRPVIVAPHLSDHSIAIAASYEARPYGVGRGVKIGEAKKLCPGLHVAYARHDVYVRMHHRLMAEIGRHAPIKKVYSVDEAACRLDRTERRRGPAIDLAMRIKRGLAENVGPALRASIGLAPNVLLAKLAAERIKPDGLTVYEPADLPGALLEIPLTDIPGIGQGIAARLARAGIADVHGLWALQPKQARAIWGSVQGERFWRAFHGDDIPDLETQKRAIGHGRMLPPDRRTPATAKPVARALVLKAAMRLRHYGLAAAALSAGARFSRGGRWRATQRVPATQDSFALLGALDHLWPALVAEARRRGRLSAVSIYLHGLRDPARAQLDLFAAPISGRKSSDALWAAIDALNRRYGRNAISLAAQRELSLDYLGAKIAFSRIPELAEFQM